VNKRERDKMFTLTLSFITSVPVRKSHNIAVLSIDPVANVLVLELSKPRQTISPEWPFRVWMHLPVGTSQSCMARARKRTKVRKEMMK
jgi:hypothetical protein